jgi:hypothetical protein
MERNTLLQFNDAVFAGYHRLNRIGLIMIMFSYNQGFIFFLFLSLSIDDSRL